MSAKDPNQAALDKTAQIFQEICPGHYKNLLDPVSPKSKSEIGQELVARVSRIFAERFGPEKAQDFAIHVTGFPSDVAFLVALFLYPERFTDDEVAAGIRCFGIEASYHAVAIAKMLKYTDEK
jgi:hypothetical protein